MGIPSLLKNFLRFPSQMMKKGRGPNRKLTPEEVMSPTTQMRNAMGSTAMRNAMPRNTAMRAKKVGDETMQMIRDSVMKMDIPPPKKVEAVRSAATAIRNANSAQLAQADPTKLTMDILKMVGAGGAGFLGGLMMEGAAREGRLPEMIQDSFLVRPEFRGMREPSQAVGEMMGATQMSPADYEYTLPFEEPLGEGMIPDLFLDPVIDKLLGD